MRRSKETRRSHVEMVADILKVARKGAKKTRIVYTANLNFKVLRDYLGRLEKAGLVTTEGATIHTTDKGKAYLKYYQGFMDFGLL